jgi:flagellar protein FliS
MYESRTNAYQQTNVLTADPKRLVIMCYEGAISNLKMAVEHYSAGQYEAKGKAITHAHDIISELMAALDYDKGGEIAKRLAAIYKYMLRAIIEADVRKDIGTIKDVVTMLEELKSAWREIFYGRKHMIHSGLATHSSSDRRERGYSEAYG